MHAVCKKIRGLSRYILGCMDCGYATPPSSEKNSMNIDDRIGKVPLLIVAMKTV